MAKIQATAFKAEEPMLKVWLIPSTDSSKLYLVSKHSHCCSDGLDMLQMYSQMQDSREARIAQAVKRPPRPTVSLISMLLSFPSSLYSLHCFWWRDFYKHLSFIKDHERG